MWQQAVQKGSGRWGHLERRESPDGVTSFCYRGSSSVSGKERKKSYVYKTDAEAAFRSYTLEVKLQKGTFILA